MRSAKSVGQTVGLALLVQLLVAPPVYFVWLRPVVAADFLANAARSALQIRVALLLTFLLGGMTFVAAIAAAPVVRRHSERMALAYVAISVVGLATLAIESITIRNMLSLSLEYAKPAASKDLLQSLGGLAHSTWYAAHCTNLMIAHGSVFVLYLILYRFALVPRPLAAFGMAATLLSTAVAAMPLLGYSFVFLLILPTALSDVALILWLLVRGFEDRQQPRRVAAEAVGLAPA